ncbi:Werner Syndrome-like exonuclease [Sesamum angolense]|uniref:Werner Syndrome-like exonuclease n=1 Tax=Sesamum angolense TaxID=2727404 RepID=A0AAE1X2D2_9LAMI|nr:Werner Syndrome-like exonuclease [Sesamum angolense]
MRIALIPFPLKGRALFIFLKIIIYIFRKFRHLTFLLPRNKIWRSHIYSRTVEEVERAAEELLEFVEVKKRKEEQCIFGLDIEWRPTFRRGVAPGKAAVLQICGENSCCYVLHIIHSHIPKSLQRLLEDQTSIKLPKPKKIRLGNWEVAVLSQEQLNYAATDAYVSWYLYQVLKNLPDLLRTKKVHQKQPTNSETKTCMLLPQCWGICEGKNILLIAPAPPPFLSITLGEASVSSGSAPIDTDLMCSSLITPEF